MSPLSVPACCRCLIAEIIDLKSDSSQWANQISHLISESGCKCRHPQWCCAQWHGEGARTEEEGRKSVGKKTAGGCVVLRWTWTCCVIQHLPKLDREARWDKRFCWINFEYFVFLCVDGTQSLSLCTTLPKIPLAANEEVLGLLSRLFHPRY